MKIVLSLLVLLALSPDAYAQFRSLSAGDHVKFRAAAPPPIASVPPTDQFPFSRGRIELVLQQRLGPLFNTNAQAG